MRIAAVGDVHGREHLDAFRADLETLGSVDLFLLAGDTTDRNDGDAFDAVLEALRASVTAPVLAVFGNNEWSQDHPAYAERAERRGVRILRDEAVPVEAPGARLTIVGSLGSLDRPTWWQRRNLPHLAREYAARVEVLDGLLAGDGPRVLLTHYPPTYATMGGEKEEWRPELGCRALEPVLLRRRPALVIHGHIHKGIPFAELRGTRTTLESFDAGPAAVPVHNVAYPVRRSVSVFEF